MVAAPSNYDNSGLVISVDPEALFSAATGGAGGHVSSLVVVSKSLGDELTAIGRVWKELDVAWAGRSAAQAEDFANRYDAAVKYLFDHVLHHMAVAAGGAAINYAEAEQSITQMFNDFRDGIANSSSAPPQGPGRNDDNGPVTEHAPVPP
jgi:hypothetical protein